MPRRIEKERIIKKRYTANDRYALREDFIALHDGNPIECAGCGEKFFPPYYTGMHCHHTFPVEKFPEKFYDIENIKAVCRKCHYKIHWALSAYQRLKRRGH